MESSYPPALGIPTATGGEPVPWEVLAFGPFRLDRVQHVLRKAGQPLRVGGRALEILLALLERPGETVSKKELLERVWRQGAVEEGTMRVHISTLHRILGNGESGTPYVQNVPGRGYRFAAPVARVRDLAGASGIPASGCGGPPSDEGRVGPDSNSTPALPAEIAPLVVFFIRRASSYHTCPRFGPSAPRHSEPAGSDQRLARDRPL